MYGTTTLPIGEVYPPLYVKHIPKQHIATLKAAVIGGAPLPPVLVFRAERLKSMVRTMAWEVMHGDASFTVACDLHHKVIEAIVVEKVDGGLGFHPLADLFPLIEGREFADLVADVKANGLLEPIVLHEGRILDGRNRYRAACEAGIDPAFRVYEGSDPAKFVVSTNFHRRHLDESQRAMIATSLATLRHGQKKADASIEASSQGEAAELLNVSRASVQRAKEVVDRGAPELVEATKAGKVSVSAAAAVASLPKEEQAAILAAGPKAIREKAKEVRERAKPAAEPEPRVANGDMETLRTDPQAGPSPDPPPDPVVASGPMTVVAAGWIDCAAPAPDAHANDSDPDVWLENILAARLTAEEMNYLVRHCSGCDMAIVTARLRGRRATA